MVQPVFQNRHGWRPDQSHKREGAKIRGSGCRPDGCPIEGVSRTRNSAARGSSLKDLLVQKRHGFDAGDIKTLAAAQVLTRDFVVQKHHVALRFLKTGAVALIRSLRDAVLFL